MTQQNWPFEITICGLESGQEINDAAPEDPDDADMEADAVNYIVQGQQLVKGSARAWQVAS